MADEAERTALNEIESLATDTVFSNMRSGQMKRIGGTPVYLRHEDTEYELQFSVDYREK